MDDNGSSRRVLVLTGTRAEYGLLKPVMEKIRAHESLSLSLVATGMHLLPQYGRTIEDIRDDGFTVDREVLMQVDGDTGKAMAKSVGMGTACLAEAFESLDPNIVLLLGDRDEALAGTIAAVHMNVPVAHIQGGDTTQGGLIDDTIRHAITKFAHLHFPASERSADRIRKMGEEAWRITTVGAPGLDDILSQSYEDPETVLAKYGFDPDRPIILVVQHPVTTQAENAGAQMAETLDAVTTTDAQIALIYPNSDAGSERIMEEIESRSFGDEVAVFRSLPRPEYLALMDAGDAMVGNSSSGIIEAPSFDLPVVDVGPRQDGRERGANTLSVPHDTEAIRDAIGQCLTDESFRARAMATRNPYDYGGASEQICERLATVDINQSLLRKQLNH